MVAEATGDQGDGPMRRRTVLATVSAGILAPLDHALTAPANPTTAAQHLGTEEQYRRARQLFNAGQLPQLIGTMPGLLAAAHADSASHEPAAYAQLAACYTLGSETLNKVGAYEASRLTADRAVNFADLAESPLSKTVAARALGIVLRHEGDHALANEVTLAAANALEATGLPTPEHTATYTLALCTCAYNAAVAGQRDIATSLITEAWRAAADLEVSTPSRHPFALTAAQVTLYWACPVLTDIQDQGTGVSGRMSIIMENMAKKRARPRRSFTPEFKAEIVELCQRGDRTVRQVSQDFDLTETAVRDWVKQADLDTGTRTDGLTSTERDELAQLRRENRRLREDVDILKRATAFFAKETR
jgi:transposase